MRAYWLVLSTMLTLASAAYPARAVVLAVPSTSDDGTKIIEIKGEFEADQDLSTLEGVVREFQPSMIVFDSPGGSIYAAMKLGRFIREMGLPTVQLRALTCTSACALAFMGGTERYAEPGSIGVHQSFFAETSGLPAENMVAAVQGVTADVIAYMQDMGIDPGLLQLSLRYQSWDIRYLSASEMAQYHVTTASEAPVSANTATASARPTRPSVPAKPTAPDSFGPVVLTNDTELPTPASVNEPLIARTGQVRYPRGWVDVLDGKGGEAKAVVRVENHTPVTILQTDGRWYYVETADHHRGYLHSTWVKVDQYFDAGFDERFIQIKSFADRREAANYVQKSPIPVASYLSNNGWYAVTLAQTYGRDAALAVLNDMKSKGKIPGDSFATYGNTYVEKVCCD